MTQFRDENTPVERARTFLTRGAPRKLSGHALSFLLSMMATKVPQVTIRAFAISFRILYYGNRTGPEVPRYRTIMRAVINAEYTRKVSKVRSRLQDPVEALHFLKQIAFVTPKNLVDIDGMNNNPESFLEKYGWSIKGKPAERLQLRCGGISYSALAAHSEEGFIAWRIFEGMATANDVASFVNDEVRRVVNPDSFCIIDNASVNKVDDTLRALNKVFH